jgi:hypothetical protein
MGVELTLNVSETMRLLPDGWEEFFDRNFAESDPTCFKIGMRSDRIITYNLCFGCMSGI